VTAYSSDIKEQSEDASYEFRVCAKNAVGEGPPSEPITVNIRASHSKYQRITNADILSLTSMYCSSPVRT